MELRIPTNVICLYIIYVISMFIRVSSVRSP